MTDNEPSSAALIASEKRPPEGFQGFRCACGEWVAVVHQECLALLTDEQRRRLDV